MFLLCVVREEASKEESAAPKVGLLWRCGRWIVWFFAV